MFCCAWKVRVCLELFFRWTKVGVKLFLWVISRQESKGYFRVMSSPNGNGSGISFYAFSPKYKKNKKKKKIQRLHGEKRIRLKDVMKQINMKIVLNKFREVNVWIDLPPSFYYDYYLFSFFNIWIPADECRHLSYGKTINHFSFCPDIKDTMEFTDFMAKNPQKSLG